MKNKVETEILFSSFAAELLAMQKTDQEMRRDWEKTRVFSTDIDRRNTARLAEIVREVGWPTISKVGLDASSAAWLLVQHADHDPAFQERCLGFMQEAGNDVNPANIAYLTDRVRVGKNQPQMYGTQFGPHPQTGTYGPYPIEDEAHLDERRASVGLGPFAEYKKEMEGLNDRITTSPPAS